VFQIWRRWLKIVVRILSTDGQTDGHMESILYFLQCFALHWTCNNILSGLQNGLDSLDENLISNPDCHREPNSNPISNPILDPDSNPNPYLDPPTLTLTLVAIFRRDFVLMSYHQ